MVRRPLTKAVLVFVALGVVLGGVSPISRSYHELDQSIHTYRMELVGYLGDMLLELGPSGTITEIQKQGEYAYVSYVYNWENGKRKGGFFIIDVSDPRSPSVVSQFPLDDTRTFDVKINHDSTLAVLSGEPVGSGDFAKESFLGITIVDISDKASPKLLSRLENRDPSREDAEPHGVHNLYIHDDYVYYVAGVRGTVVVDISNPSDPIEVAIMPNAEMKNEEGRQRHDVFPHDVFVQTHPSGRVFAYIANWDAGAQIWDVTVPSYPLRVGSWNELGPAFQNTHFVRPSPSGKITVVGPEFGLGFSGFLSILDTSDVQNPKLLSTWAIPGHRWQRASFSWTQHNFDVTEDRIYLANYSAGVWAIDISDPMNPRILGSFGPESYNLPPHPETREQFQEDLERAKSDPLLPKYPWVGTWSVEEVDGLLYASDMPTGLYILRLIEDADSAHAEDAAHDEVESDHVDELDVESEEEDSEEVAAEAKLFHLRVQERAILQE